MRKNYTLFNYCMFALIAFSLLFLNSCSKENEEAKTEKPTGLTTDEAQYAPYQIVTITSSQKIFSSQSGTAKINNLEIPLETTDNSASFLLPNLENGNYVLSFSSNEIKYEVPIKVTALTNVLSADVYFDKIKGEIAVNISNLNAQINQLEQSAYFSEEHIALKNDVARYNNMINTYTDSYNQLTADQKLEFAKMMAANNDVFEEQNKIINNFRTYTGKQAQSVSDYEANVREKAKIFVQSVFKTVDLIPKVVGLAILANTPIHPFINAGAIIAAGIYVAKFLISAADTITAAIDLTNSAVKPSEFVDETAKIATIEYETAVEKATSIQANYRSLTASDANDSGITIQSIAENYNYFKDQYLGLINELPDFFKPSYLMPGLKNTYSKAKRTVFNKYISISNISNPDVTLEQINEPDGSIKLRASTLLTTDQTFTYDINYTNTSFANNLKKTVSAKVIAPVDSLAIYRAAVVGNWTMNWHDPGSQTQNQIDKFKFDSDGNGSYYWMKCSGCPDGQSIEPTNPVYRITWQVRRVSAGVWYLDTTYPDRGWFSSAQIFIKPNIHCGVPITTGLYFLGTKD